MYNLSSRIPQELFGWLAVPQRHKTKNYFGCRIGCFKEKMQQVERPRWYRGSCGGPWIALFDSLNPVAILISYFNMTRISVRCSSFCISLLLKEIFDLCSMRQSIVLLYQRQTSGFSSKWLPLVFWNMNTQLSSRYCKQLCSVKNRRIAKPIQSSCSWQ